MKQSSNYTLKDLSFKIYEMLFYMFFYPITPPPPHSRCLTKSALNCKYKMIFFLQKFDNRILKLLNKKTFDFKQLPFYTSIT